MIDTDMLARHLLVDAIECALDATPDCGEVLDDAEVCALVWALTPDALETAAQWSALHDEMLELGDEPAARLIDAIFGEH